MEVARRPIAELLVNHKNVTGLFSPWLLSVNYTDHLAGESDGLEVTLDDSEGRWLNEWYPVTGTSLEAYLGYEGESLLGTGVCTVDEIEIGCPPSTVTVRALGAGNKTALRTRKSKAYEGKSLRIIATEVAAAHSLTLVGSVPDIVWSRVTQHRETDLGFLNRVGEEHGLIFSVKGDKLVFHDLEKLEALPKILKIRPADLASYQFREKVQHGAASSSYFDGSTKTLRTEEVAIEGYAHPDKHKIHRRTESPSHSKRLAKMALRIRKDWQRDGTLSLEGNPLLVAGGNVELDDFGKLNGLWQIISARHQISKSQGYTTELEVRHVAS